MAPAVEPLVKGRWHRDRFGWWHQHLTRTAATLAAARELALIARTEEEH